ncbi:MAG: hypothetical protein ACXWUG_22510 [Polyangiales bacterium]
MKVSSLKASCGLYRTTRPLATAPDRIGAGILINLHSCPRLAAQGPVVHLPQYSAFNRWAWCHDSHSVSPLSWIETLIALPAEGFYLLREPLEFEAASWPAQSLVQLGYDRAGTPLLFLAQRRRQLAENDLIFADAGIPLPLDRLSVLAPIVVYEEPDPSDVASEPHAA